MRCKLARIRVRPTRRRNLKVVEGVVVDAAGVEEKVVWFNQAHLAKLAPGTELLLHGTRDLKGFKVSRHELGGAGVHTLGLVPEYPATEALPSYRIRALVEAALPLARRMPDALPQSSALARGLPLRADAIAAVHRPESLEDAEAARARLGLEELLLLQLGFVRRREALAQEARATALGEPGELLDRYRRALPFTLTPEQEEAIAQIDADLRDERPMQRLLQGDVGSGKTVVALYALLRAVERGKQGALMAPTETLAEQHFLTLEPICAELGVRVSLQTGSVKHELEGAQILVGTHALIQEGVALDDLAVAVIDEQHRFGVEQRRALAEGRSAHVLHMTATPIPRTLAQTVYGDLDVTEIARPPRGRQPVITSWVSHERSAEAYKRLRRHLDDGRQAYVVCPLVSESETIEARAAEQEAERLRSAELRGYRVGSLHGRLRPSDRRALMDEFKRGELDVLVATTVIEVGRRRPERDDHDRPGGRSLRPRAAPPAARTRRPGRRAVVLPPRLSPEGGAHRGCAAAPAGARGHERRVRARRGRPRAQGRGTAPRHAPVGPQRPEVRPPRPRPEADRPGQGIGRAPGRGGRRGARPAPRGGPAH